jgi:hypothetical protein
MSKSYPKEASGGAPFGPTNSSELMSKENEALHASGVQRPDHWPLLGC